MSETRPATDLFTLPPAGRDVDFECRTYLEELRWPAGIACPRCGHKTTSRIKARQVFDCDGCRYQFSVTAGTLFHDSHLPLAKWFLAIFLMCESKKRMSASQLKRILEVSYKTAWYLCHRIRVAMAEPNASPLTGPVEVDDTYIGRGRGMGSGALSPFKRAQVGSFHQISDKHVDRYAGEFEFRLNNRKNPYQFRDVLLRLMDAKALPYARLTKSAVPTAVRGQTHIRVVTLV